MDIITFKLAFAIYFISTLGYFSSMYIRRVLIAKVTTWFLTAAFVTHTFFFIFRYAETKHLPVVGLHEAFSLFAWSITGIYLAFQLKTKTRILGTFVSPVSLLLMILASAGLGGQVPISHVLQGNLVPIHVVFSITGEALFSLASLAGAMYLIQEGLIKNKKAGGFIRLLPSLTDLDRINHASLFWGFPLLTVGILVGALWAHTVWGSPWQWDPKLLWALAAWIFYTIILHQRLAIGWRGHKAALFSLMAFGILIVSLVIISSFFTTVHSFI